MLARPCFAFALLCLVTATVLAAEAGKETVLFDGKSLDHWVITECDVAVEDGLLVLKAGEGLVRSKEQYGDFMLDIDWRARKAEAYDSGIYFRAELPTGKAHWPKKYQINLKQNDEGNVGPLPAARSKGLAKVGQWNHFRLKVVGDKAELEINGQPAWKAEGVEPARGYVGLQAEVTLGGQYEFRNIRLTELK